MNKFKAFFANKITRIVCGSLFVVGAIGLTVGGITQEALSGTLVATVGVVTAVSAVISIVSAMIKK